MAVQEQTKHEYNFIYLVRQLSTVLAILPPRSFFNPDHRKLCVFYKCYVVFILLVLLIGTILGILGRARDAYPIFPASTLVITDITVAISITATNLASILAPTVWYLKDYKLFSEIFEKTNNCLMKCESIKIKSCKAFFIQLFAGHLILFAAFAYDAYIWIMGLGFTQYRHYIFRNFQGYHLYITIITMDHVALVMKYGFEMINNDLKKLNGFPIYKCDNITQLDIKMEKIEYYYMVRHLTQKYEMQLKQVSLFNKIFGWQILFITLSVMMGLLNSLDILTVYIPSAEMPNGISKEAFGYGLVSLGAIWAIWHLVLGAVVTISCTSTAKTAQETADLCFNILLKMPVLPTNAKDKALRNELTLLKDLAVNRCPVFSAAGFFSVDYSLFLATFASVMSYVIVLIQFHK